MINIRNLDFEHECRIRNYFASNLKNFRPDEEYYEREGKYEGSNVRVDIRTVDKYNVLREWEFKIEADYTALGQILTYVALAREEENFNRIVRGVIAAFDFQDELCRTIEVMNLGIELVRLPIYLRHAGTLGDYDTFGTITTGITIPNIE